ncbi:aldehyde dehydrogenase family protein [Paraburkholderia caballeronis]|uniref:aldehyde dehydrogenase family protein n=1 Tax=Paraburkholderia caballeronis TaxID=416943 RepID=UPI00210BC4E2|nr:aldehyde dehydrogenase family protein [Paraburkholderia caballeronis]
MTRRPSRFLPFPPRQRRSHDISDTLRIANDSMYGLSGSIWTANRERDLDAASRIRAGRLSVRSGQAGFSPLVRLNWTAFLSRRAFA